MIVLKEVMDTARFKKEVLPLKDKLYRFSLRLLGDREEALDALQEVFIKLWNIREKLDGYKSIEALSVTVTKNHCLDRLKAMRTVSIEENSFTAGLMDAGSDLVKETETMEKTAIIRQLIELLPDQQKMIIQMRDIEGYEFEEMEKMLELKVNAIRVNLSRARKKIKEEYIKYENEELGQNQGFTGKIL